MTKTKKHIEGMDILYRVVLAGTALSIPFFAFFSKLFYLVLQSDALKGLSQLMGKEDTGATLIEKSLYELFQMQSGSSDSYFRSEKFLEIISPLKEEIISMLVFFILTILLALAVFVVACFVKSKLVPLCLGGAGIVSCVLTLICFSATVAPLISGQLSLSALLGMSHLFSPLLAMVASVSTFRVNTAWYMMLFAFIAIVIWTGAFMLLDLGESKDKKAPRK